LFSNIIPYNTVGLFINNYDKLDPEYISGFTTADGSFFVSKPAVGSK
jgi:hypothetical protein